MKEREKKKRNTDGVALFFMSVFNVYLPLNFYIYDPRKNLRRN